PSNSLTRTEPQIRSKDSATLPPPQPTNPLFRQGSFHLVLFPPPPTRAQDVHVQNDAVPRTQRPVPQRRTSLDAMRRMEIDENYSDEDDVRDCAFVE
ncbi:hypothetical protein COCCADRAFT_112178, partial [Bipolaris zeicola 26-R-13]